MGSKLQAEETTFLRNAWYCAGFEEELADGATKAVTMLEEPVVLFRRADGSVAALADRCPHRFAPLSRGRREEDALVCGYHGLKFDGHGHCVHNPHGDGSVPKAAQVRAYPAMSRYGALWVWMGDPSKAAPERLADFSGTEPSARVARVQGYLSVQAHYGLVADNLLDLSHVQYLHPFLATRDVPPPPDFSVDVRMEQVGQEVFSVNELHNAPISGLYRMLWGEGAPPPYIHMRANMRWSPPSLLLLDTGAHPEGAPRSDGPTSMQGHWLTPETRTTTHYFWCATRDRHVEDAAVGERMQAGIDSAFRNEDEPMIEAVQRRMGTADLMSLKPVLLVGDGAGMRARRVLDGLIAAERSDETA
jgi:vanillate O-demethylase monooxygenase subunit